MSAKTVLFQALLDKYAPKLAKAFRDAINDLAKGADIPAVRRALQANDVNAAIEAMHLDPEAFSGFEEAFRTSFLDAGGAQARELPRSDALGRPINVRFSGRNGPAEAFLRDHSSNMVSEILDETRTVVRETMVRGLEVGDNPTKIVPEVVGRIDASGRRSGGVLGLTAKQNQRVTDAAQELSSGSRSDLNSYLSRPLRDKRFDRSISKYAKDAKPVPQEIAKPALDSYRNRLLAYRAKVIGRTETMTAINRAKHAAFQQAIADGKIDATKVTKIWRSAHDARVRQSHAVLDGKRVGFDEPFASPIGNFLQFPMDTSMGATADDIIQCRCQCEYKIDFFAGVK